MDCDILLLCPFGPKGGGDTILGRESRTSIGPTLIRARSEFHSWLGHDLSSLFFNDAEPAFIGTHAIRSATAMTLATTLERAGLSWTIIDPGPQNLGAWREALLAHKQRTKTAIVGISTTFLSSPIWTRYLVRIARDVFPSTPLLVGGYLYASDPKVFLTLDADVFVVGEGEERLPQIVRRLKAGRSLDDIPGLYLARNGEIRSTGSAEQLSLRDRTPTDWSLASRIEPPLSIARDPMQAWVETQRGCVFKCEFCTYRTLAAPQMLGVDEATDRIMAAAHAVTNGFVYIADSTATFPHDRWRRILEAMIARGGSPRPIWAFARMSDLKADIVALMARAGVTHVFVGQESGDQRMLDLMQKATRLEHVQPAIDAMRQHGLTATIGLIHNFPGENLESIASTRRLLGSLNAGCPDRPVALIYNLSPFILQAFSAYAQHPDEPTARRAHAKGLPWGRVPDADMLREYYRTLVETSKIPHAPIGLFFVVRGEPESRGFMMAADANGLQLFRLLKAYERGITVFLEHFVFGVPVDQAELQRVRTTLANGDALTRARRCNRADRVQAAFMRRLGREWSAEEEGARPGHLTRLLVAATAKGALHLGWRDTLATYRLGFASATEPRSAPTAAGQLSEFSQDLINEGTQKGRQKLSLAADGGTTPVSFLRGKGAATVS